MFRRPQGVAGDARLQIEIAIDTLDEAKDMRDAAGERYAGNEYVTLVDSAIAKLYEAVELLHIAEDTY